MESTLLGDEANLSYTNDLCPDVRDRGIALRQAGPNAQANQQAPVILRIADLAVMTVQTQVSEADALGG
jgi:macrolide-specific efflux system membrane fusion protein